MGILRWLLILACLACLGLTSKGQKPGPSTKQSKCPAVTVTCPEFWLIGQRLVMRANVNGRKRNRDLSYKWSVPQCARITSGEATHEITIVPLSLNGWLVAGVEIGGLPEGCPNKAECTTSVMEYFGPAVTVDCPTTAVRVGKPVDFTVNISGPYNLKPKFTWKLSDGRILKGQGTGRIRVSTKNVKAEKITATIYINGWEPSYVSEVSCTVNLKTDQ
jgi:hypothetical protein